MIAAVIGSIIGSVIVSAMIAGVLWLLFQTDFWTVWLICMAVYMALFAIATWLTR